MYYMPSRLVFSETGADCCTDECAIASAHISTDASSDTSTIARSYRCANSSTHNSTDARTYTSTIARTYGCAYWHTD
jgi:hypothetical protein